MPDQPTYVFTLPTGKKWEVPISYTKEGHKNFDWFTNKHKEITEYYGKPPEMSEKGVDIPGAKVLKGLLSIGRELVFPSKGREVGEKEDANFFEKAYGVSTDIGGTLMDKTTGMIPNEISAGTVRGSTDMVLPTVGGILGGIGGGTVGVPAGPAGVAAGAITGRAAGGAGGQMLANKIQEALGVQPSGANPLIAGAIEAVALPGGAGVSNVGRGVLRGGFGATKKKAAKSQMEEVASAYRRMGVDDPAVPQLVQDIGGPVPTRNVMTSLQQLSMDLPYTSVTENWLRKNLNKINQTLADTFGNRTAKEVSDEMRESVIIGTKQWDSQLGRQMDETYLAMPKGYAQDVSIKPIIDELASLGVVNNEVLAKLATGDKGEQLLAAFVNKYSTPTGQMRGNMVGRSFQDVPVGEVEEIRKALGATFKNNESILSKTIAQKDRNRIYGAMRESVRTTMEGLETAGKMPKGSVAKYETAMAEWSAKSIEENKYVDKLVKELTPSTRSTYAIDAQTRGKFADVDQVRALKKRIEKDPTYRSGSWSDVQDVIIEANAMEGKNFNMEKFRGWYKNMDDEIRDEIFDKEHQRLLDDMFTVSEGPWPQQRQAGPTFIGQQMFKPVLAAGTVGAGVGGYHALQGSEGNDASAMGAKAALLTGLAMVFAPGMAQRAMTNKKALKFITESATLDPKAFHAKASAIAGGLANALANPDNEEQYEEAMAIYAYIDARSQLDSMILNMGKANDQTQGQQIPGQMPGILGQ